MGNRTLSIGKARSLQASSTKEGIFSILAIDHRDALRILIEPKSPDSVSEKQLTDLKLDVVEAIAPFASAVLLDPLYSLAQGIQTHAIPGHIGLLTSLEEQGYLGDPDARQTPILKNWGIEKAKRLGANGVKLLLLYHPDAGVATQKQEALVSALVEECRKFEIPLFLEPILYSLDPKIEKRSEEFAEIRPDLIIESVRKLTALEPDILKVEFPVDPRFQTNHRVWSKACSLINQVSTAPWVLLSAGDPYSIFKEQLQIACEAGCSGFMVGRAVWREAIDLHGEKRTIFLAETAVQRFKELASIAQQYASPWNDRYSVPNVDENWYRGY